MRYQFTNQEVKKGDYCIFVWGADLFSSKVNDTPVSKAGETTFGEWAEGNGGSICNIPVVVEGVDDEYVTLRPFKFTEDGKHCEFIYTKGHAEPVSLQVLNTDGVFPRLIKSQWAKPQNNNIDEKYISHRWRALNLEDLDKCDIFKEGMRQGYRKAKEE